MEFIDERTIKLDRILSDLDKQVIRFTKMLQKHTDYVLVSGYVSILFGRSRNTEDVDVIVPKMEKARFMRLFNELTSSGYWFINSSDAEDLHSLLEDSSIRAADNGQVYPNFEMKFARKKPDMIALDGKLKVRIGEEVLLIAPLELQIAYKEKVLASDKDFEDARHLRAVFAEHLNNELITDYLSRLEA